MSVYWREGSLNTLREWSWVFFREGSLLGRLSDMQQGLKELGEGAWRGASTWTFQTLWIYRSQGLGWSFHPNTTLPHEDKGQRAYIPSLQDLHSLRRETGCTWKDVTGLSNPVLSHCGIKSCLNRNLLAWFEAEELLKSRINLPNNFLLCNGFRCGCQLLGIGCFPIGLMKWHGTCNWQKKGFIRLVVMEG